MSLHERQQVVLQGIADGLTDEEIGARLYLSPWTVKSRIRKLMDILGAGNRAQAVHRAYQLGHLHPKSPLLTEREQVLCAAHQELLEAHAAQGDELRDTRRDLTHAQMENATLRQRLDAQAA